MKIKFYHFFNILLAALIALMGFSSCDEIEDVYGPPPNYEQPLDSVTTPNK